MSEAVKQMKNKQVSCVHLGSAPRFTAGNAGETSLLHNFGTLAKVPEPELVHGGMLPATRSEALQIIVARVRRYRPGDPASDAGRYRAKLQSGVDGEHWIAPLPGDEMGVEPPCRD